MAREFSGPAATVFTTGLILSVDRLRRSDAKKRKRALEDVQINLTNTRVDVLELKDALANTTRDFRDEIKRTERITVQASPALIEDPKQKKEVERLMARFFSFD